MRNICRSNAIPRIGSLNLSPHPCIQYDQNSLGSRPNIRNGYRSRDFGAKIGTDCALNAIYPPREWCTLNLSNIPATICIGLGCLDLPRFVSHHVACLSSKTYEYVIFSEYIAYIYLPVCIGYSPVISALRLGVHNGFV